jgi:hypothetical protein
MKNAGESLSVILFSNVVKNSGLRGDKSRPLHVLQ